MDRYELREMRELLEESSAFLDRIHAKDRARAEQRLQEDPSSLSSYELGLIGKTRAQVMAPPPRDEFRDAATAALRPAGIAFRSAYLEGLNQHAVDLAAEHRIRVIRLVSGYPRARWEERTIFCPPVTNEKTYAICLHEVAHIIDPDADSRQYRHTVFQEASFSYMTAAGGETGAWRWAVEHAKGGWTAEMQDELYSGLSGHAQYDKTTDELHQMSCCVLWAALRIVDKPWTFAELKKKQAALTGEPCL